MAWPRGRSRDGGIDEIPLPGVAGHLYLCGKHAIGPDPERVVAQVDADIVLCLNEPHEIGDRYPDYVEWLAANAGTRAWHHPVPDFHAPELGALETLVDSLHARVVAGDTLLVHCGGGIGRAGTIAVALLLRLGVAFDDALELVRSHRPMAGPEVGAQRDVLEAFDLVCRSRTIQDR